MGRQASGCELVQGCDPGLRPSVWGFLARLRHKEDEATLGVVLRESDTVKLTNRTSARALIGRLGPD